MKISSKITITNNALLYDMVALFWYSLIIVDIVRKLIPNSNVSTYTRNILYVAVFVYVIYHMFKNKKASVLIVPLVLFLLLISISCFAYPQLIEIVGNTMLLFIVRCLSGLYLSYCIEDYQLAIDRIVKWCWIGLLYSIMIFLMGHDVFENYMSLSYALLIPALLSTYTGMNENRIVLAVSGIVMMMAILTYGARGPIVCLLVSILFVIFGRANERTKLRTLFLTIIFLFFIGYVILSYDSIIERLYSMYPNSRTINMLKTGNFMDLSGRDRIFTTTIEAIRNNPIQPHGLMADRVLLGHGSINEGIYPHNLALELWYQFGIIGVGLFSWIVLRIIRTFFGVILFDCSICRFCC